MDKHRKRNTPQKRNRSWELPQGQPAVLLQRLSRDPWVFLWDICTVCIGMCASSIDLSQQQEGSQTCRPIASQVSIFRPFLG